MMNDQTGSENKRGSERKISRRKILKNLATLPVFGVFFLALQEKYSRQAAQKDKIMQKLGLTGEDEAPAAPVFLENPGDLVRIGIIGIGSRGEQLAQGLGFGHPDWIARQSEEELQDWLAQEDLNAAITGICDVFDQRAVRGVEISECEFRPARIRAKRYPSYHEMLASPEIDAVLIATPDFHHAPMSIAAAEARKHVYCEKCMTRTEEEVYAVEEAVKRNGIVYQLGHQTHHSSAYQKARDVIRKNLLGKVTLVESTSNRNSPYGAWVRHLDQDGRPKPGDPKSIDWEEWLGNSPKIPFNIERYYNWTLWWDYATGLSGQLMSHEIDTANQLLGLGIPDTCTASGGIYFYKDGRDIPDIFNALFEYKSKDLTFMYSASLENGHDRGRRFMGHDATMELGDKLEIAIDRESTRYHDEIKAGLIDTGQPLLTFNPGSNRLDAVTSASEKYYASRGLYYTYHRGRLVDTTYLHLREFLNAIRYGTPVSVPVEKAVEVTIACHMATRSYREQRQVKWDRNRGRIV
jgi:predicted dehydrogenase